MGNGRGRRAINQLKRLRPLRLVKGPRGGELLRGLIFQAAVWALSFTITLGAEILRNRLVPADATPLRAGLGVDTMPLYGILAGGWWPEIREDFGAGGTVTVAGWMLSETEVRICALAALEGA